MEKQGWKILAIVMIVFSILLILSFGFILKLGTDSLELENQCSINVCSGYESYYFDILTNVCECYTDGEIKYQEYLT